MSIVDDLRLDGKVTLVTGAGRGIGEGMMISFAEVRADLALVSRMASDLEKVGAEVKALGRKAVIIPVDVSDLGMNTNLRDVYFMTQAAGRVMAAQRHGKIINLTSIAAIRGFEQLSIYGMTKAAVGLLTQVLGVEWAQYNIQVNGIAPG